MAHNSAIIPVHRIDTSTPYDAVTQMQEDLVSKGEEALLLCEHPPTITMGTSTKTDDLKFPESYYASQGITLHKSPRGGQVTYHGPGQLVAYPVLNIRRRGKDVNWHLRLLEDLLIHACNHYEITAEAIAGKAGAWVGPRKIGFLGIRVRRGCCYHGLSLNVTPQGKAFSGFVPCGFENLHVTSIHEESNHTPTVRDVADIIESYTMKRLLDHESPTQIA